MTCNARLSYGNKKKKNPNHNALTQSTFKSCSHEVQYSPEVL